MFDICSECTNAENIHKIIGQVQCFYYGRYITIPNRCKFFKHKEYIAVGYYYLINSTDDKMEKVEVFIETTENEINYRYRFAKNTLGFLVKDLPQGVYLQKIEG